MAFGELMNTCIISGLLTNNKYKNMLIHPDVIDAAKALVLEQGGDMTSALRYLSLALAESTMQRFEQGDILNEDV
jgi:hypothetical protein